MKESTLNLQQAHSNGLPHFDGSNYISPAKLKQRNRYNKKRLDRLAAEAKGTKGAFGNRHK